MMKIAFIGLFFVFLVTGNGAAVHVMRDYRLRYHANIRTLKNKLGNGATFV